MKTILFVVVSLCLFVVCVGGQVQADGLGLTLVDKTHVASDTAVRVGTMKVWENRAAQAGRIVSLDVTVLPAVGEDSVPDPMFIFSGGPGQNSHKGMNMWATHARLLACASDDWYSI